MTSELFRGDINTYAQSPLFTNTTSFLTNGQSENKPHHSAI